MLASIVGRLLLQVLTHQASRRGGGGDAHSGSCPGEYIPELSNREVHLDSWSLEGSRTQVTTTFVMAELEQRGLIRMVKKCGTAYHIGLDSCPLIRRTYRRYCELSIPLSPRRASCCLYRCSIVHVLTCRSSALDFVSLSASGTVPIAKHVN